MGKAKTTPAQVLIFCRDGKNGRSSAVPRGPMHCGGVKNEGIFDS